MKEPKKEATAVRAREAAEFELPIAERARLVLDDPRAAQRLRPQQWSETRKIGDAYSRAIGSQRPLSEMARDTGLRAIVVLLAAEYSVQDLEWVAGNVPKQAWWRSGNRVRGLGSLSIEVVSRALGERDGPKRTAERRSTNPGSEEGRRIHRNTLLENAAAGLYGAEIKRVACNGTRLKELADELERREDAGDLRTARLAAPSMSESSGLQLQSPGIARAPAHGAQSELGRTRGL